MSARKPADPRYLPKVADRIWVVQQAWDDGDGYISNSEIVMTHEYLAREAETDGWRVTEYVKVES